MDEHMKEHELFANFKRGLERDPKSTSKTKPATKAKSKAPNKKKIVNCYLLFIEEHRPKIKDDHPTLTSNEITKKLSEAWKALASSDKDRYKAKAAAMNRQNDDGAEEGSEEGCPKCGKTFPTKDAVIVHILNDHSTSQSTVHVCNICGRMCISEERLNDHNRQEHSDQVETANDIENEVVQPVDGTENTADESTAENVNGDTVQPVDGT